MINHISKFFFLFIFIILFLSFKNQIKILENDLIYLKGKFNKDHHIFINKEILLTKQINKLKNYEIDNYEYLENNKIINFDRSKFDDFTIIKVNYVKSE